MDQFFYQHGIIDRLVQGSIAAASIFIEEAPGGGPTTYLCAQQLKNMSFFFTVTAFLVEGEQIIARF